MFRIGFGRDLHKFITSHPGEHTIMLCGIPIKHQYQIDAHSDGDLAIDAVVDAMLGAMAAGDIGTHFPPSDDKWHKADSKIFLRHALHIVKQKGYAIGNVDLTIIAQYPKIGPHRKQMQQSMADTLQTDISNISIKGKTNEGMDSIGQELAICAYAVVLCYKQGLPW